MSGDAGVGGRGSGVGGQRHPLLHIPLLLLALVFPLPFVWLVASSLQPREQIGKPDQEYHEAVIRPLLGHPLVEFIGEISDAQKAEFLGNARALLFPIDWPEPFGLAMIEAMAVGTPVIAYPCGSVLELVDDGVTGYVVRSIEEAAQAVDACSHFDRSACRERASVRFSARRMARDYEAIYNRILSARLMELNRTLTALAEREPTPSMSVNIPVQGESWPSLPSESATSTTFGRDPL